MLGSNDTVEMNAARTEITCSIYCYRYVKCIYCSELIVSVISIP